jgi:signal transduction histidine kinase
VSPLCSNLSKQKRAEEALRHSEAHLAEAQSELAHVARVAMLGELTASIAHEINQPLAAVVNNASASLNWLSRDSPDLAETGQAIRRIIRDGKRAGEIVNRIRTLAKKAPPQRGWVDLNEAIGEVVAMARNAVQRGRILLHTQLTNDLPLVVGDRIQLQQVILNLLMNAIEEMSGVSEGPRELWLSSEKVTETVAGLQEEAFGDRGSAEMRRTHVLITVRDSGPGLDPKDVARLFDPFYTTKSQGLGLGLAISRSIVEAHGGRLSATANVPRGAIFRFTLPLESERK